MPPRLFAVVLPCLPIAAFVFGSGLFAPESAELASPAFGATARMLRGIVPETEVAIVGNSQAYYAVNTTVLGERLGVPDKVHDITLPGLHADGVYALLRYRIFGAGLRPKVVVLPMSFDHLLDTQVPADHNLKVLQENIPGSDPVLDAKVFGAGGASPFGPGLFGPGWTRAVGRVHAARDGWLERLTALPVRLLGEADPGARLDVARDAVLGEVAGANMALQVRAIPAIGGGRSAREQGPKRGIEDTLMPEIVELVQDHGARLVVATLPQKVQTLGTRPEAAYELAEWLAQRGVPFLHLEGIEVPPDGWLDPGHLADKGGALYTDDLAERLVEMDILGDGELEMPALPVPAPRVVRRGDPPPPQVLKTVTSPDGCVVQARVDVPPWRSDVGMSAIGMGNASLLEVTAGGQPVVPHVNVARTAGCVGQMWHAADSIAVALPSPGAELALGWVGTPSTTRSGGKPDVALEHTIYWLPPGTRLELRWDKPPPAEQLALALIQLQAGVGAPQVEIAGRVTPLVAWGETWAAEVPLGPSDLAGPVVLTSPPGGPELLLRLVGVRAGGSLQLALGQMGDVAWRSEVSGSYLMSASAPVPPTVVGANPTRWGRNLIFVPTGPAAALTSDALIALGQKKFNGCIPLAARKIGDTSGQTVLPVPTPEGRMVAPVPPEGGDDWELIWRDRRVCSRRAWVFPGETTTIQSRQPGALFVEADQMVLDIGGFPSEGLAHIRLLAGERVALEADIDLAGPRVITLPLAVPVAPHPKALGLEVTAPPGAYVSVGSCELRPTARPAWFALEAPSLAEDGQEP